VEINLFKSEIHKSHPEIDLDEIIAKMESKFTNPEGEKLNIWAGKLSGGFFLKLGKELLKFSEEKALEFLDHSNYFTGRLLEEMQPLEVGNLFVTLANEAEDSKKFDFYLLAKTFFLTEIKRQRVNGSSDPLKQDGLAYLLAGMLDELVYNKEDYALTNYLLGSEAGDSGCNSKVIWILGRQQKYVEVIEFFEKFESVQQNFQYPNVALLVASLAYTETGDLSKSNELLELLEHIGDASMSLLSTITWNRFLNDQCKDNSIFKQVIDKFGPSDEMQFINFTSNVILLELAKSRNYQEALDSWLKIIDPNHEVQLYIAASLLNLGREDESKRIINNFSILEKWNQLETIKTFEAAKGFALEWAKKCRAAISIN
jgi:tetratricopeptide (TPR) repeat protein